MDAAKRVIILTKLNSPLISQAIFILKDEDINEFSAVAEAERIVEDFMLNPPKQKRKLSVIPVLLTALSALGIILTLYFNNF